MSAPATALTMRPPGPRGRYIRNVIARVRDTLGLFLRLHRD